MRLAKADRGVFHLAVGLGGLSRRCAVARRAVGRVPCPDRDQFVLTAGPVVARVGVAGLVVAVVVAGKVAGADGGLPRLAGAASTGTVDRLMLFGTAGR